MTIRTVVWCRGTDPRITAADWPALAWNVTRVRSIHLGKSVHARSIAGRAGGTGIGFPPRNRARSAVNSTP